MLSAVKQVPDAQRFAEGSIAPIQSNVGAPRSVIAPDGALTTQRLGTTNDPGALPQAVVPAGAS